MLIQYEKGTGVQVEIGEVFPIGRRWQENISNLNPLTAGCKIANPVLVEMPSDLNSAGNSSRKIKFEANGNGTPSFVAEALSSVGIQASVLLDSNRSADFTFSDVALSTIRNEVILATVNSPSCLSGLQGQRTIGFVRGRVSGKVTISQKALTDAQVSASAQIPAGNAASQGNGASFKVQRTSDGKWSVESVNPTQWFMVVARLELRNGRYQFTN
jgi:hypothetical protein